MDYFSHQDKATEMFERHKESIEDKLSDAVDHGYKLASLLGKIEDEELLDELNYHLAKILEKIDEI